MYRHAPEICNPYPRKGGAPRRPFHHAWSDPEYCAWRASLPADPTPEQIEDLAEMGFYFMPEWPDPSGNGPWIDVQVELEEIFPSGTPLTDAWQAHQSPEDELPF